MYLFLNQLASRSAAQHWHLQLQFVTFHIDDEEHAQKKRSASLAYGSLTKVIGRCEIRSFPKHLRNLCALR